MKKSIKKLSISIFCLFSFNTFATGIPVVDGLANSTQMAEYAKEALRYAEIINQAKKDYEMYSDQLKQAKKELETISGLRDLGALWDYVYPKFGSLEQMVTLLENPEKILNAGFDSLSADLKAKVVELGFDKLCDAYKTSGGSEYYRNKLIKNCQGGIVVNMLQDASYKKKQEARAKQDKQLKDLQEHIAKSQDPKTTAEYLNQLQAMSIGIQYETMREQQDIQRQLNIREMQKLKEEQILKEKQQSYQKDISW